MLDFRNGNSDEDLAHLVDATVAHHQVVTVGSVEDFELTSIQDPAEPRTAADSIAKGPDAPAESLDDWY
ncbi:hypothetical protein OF385_08770 [Glutamicibacter sp. JL.03c]|uniref:hypothetical protein n=1 Tax=Glutamicibacter sp. JL.03c TaxID=2984842 RepID=UPI0021F7D3BF|nr:hypothetical protein [Glutamicibacter sp. JL.03c]UYQ76156.1 hypothetical protein OF385_08770 [Glutamicibacter sp. JL.03c]